MWPGAGTPATRSRRLPEAHKRHWLPLAPTHQSARLPTAPLRKGKAMSDNQDKTTAPSSTDAGGSPAGEHDGLPYELTGKWASDRSDKLYLELFAGELRVYSDEVNPQSSKDRKRWAKAALAVEPLPAGLEDIEVAGLDASITDYYNEKRNTPPPPEESPAPPPPQDTAIEASAKALQDTDSDIKRAAENLLADPALFDRVLADLDMVVAGEKVLKLLCYLHGTSRLLRKPINLIITGVTSSGKTIVRDSISEFFPPETKFVSTALTENALYYMGEFELAHRMVCLGERKKDVTDANADRTTAARELISVGRIEKTLPMKIGGELKAVKIKVEGPIALSESTTVLRIEPEDQNRCIVINTDETQEQTVQCMDASDRADETDLENPHLAASIQLHHAMQRMLKPCNVVIPFASAITRLIRDRVSHNVEMRRAWPQCKQVIKAAALLFQFQRDRTKAGSVIATLDDYEIARNLIGRWFAATINGNVSTGTAQFYEKALVALGTENPFTVSEAKKANLGGETAIRTKWLPELEAIGAVEVVDPPTKTGVGRRATWYRLAGAAMPHSLPCVLPPAESVKEAIADDTFAIDEPEGSEEDEPVAPQGDCEYRVDADGNLILGDEPLETLF